MVTNVISKFFSKFFSINLESLKCVNITFLLLNTLLVYKISKKLFKNKNWSYLATILFATSPWYLYLSSYIIQTSLTIFLILLAMNFYVSKKYKRSTISLVLLSGASLTGLAVSISLLPSIFINKKSKFAAIAFLLVLAILYSNKAQLFNLLKTPYLEQYRVTNLTQELYDRQINDYLGTNKEIILPSPIRKLTYNKPFLLTQKASEKLINIFDFEYLVAPLDSFELLKKSGNLPKGNFLALFFWQVPLIFIAILNLPKHKKFSVPLILLCLSTIFVYFINEKREFFINSYSLIPLVVLFTVYGFKILHKGNKTISKIFLFFIAIFSVTSIFRNIDYFYEKQNEYRYTHSYLFHETARLAGEHVDEKTHQIFVTTAFGPTDFSYAFYKKLDPNDYWSKKLNDEELKFDNLIFEPVSMFKLYPTSYIIGLSGEYDDKKFPTEIIKAWDEPVHQLGEELWLVRH